MPVHPHGRGNTRVSTSMMSAPGSSPRAWGNTTAPRSRSCPRPVPSSRAGKHGVGGFEAVDAGGSSPRAWGTQRRWRPVGFVFRFIPRAENTRPRPTPQPARTVHPTGGEHSSRNTHRRPSPVHPHGRGEHFCACDRVSPSSVHPSRRGNTNQASRFARATAVHPTGVGNTRVAAGRGSVLVRFIPTGGEISTGAPGLRAGRFILTGVGNTRTPRRIRRPAAVHPTGVGNTATSANHQPRPPLRFIPTGATRRQFRPLSISRWFISRVGNTNLE